MLSIRTGLRVWSRLLVKLVTKTYDYVRVTYTKTHNIVILSIALANITS